LSSGYALHLEAYADLDDIRDYIAQENPDAADRVMSEIFDAIRSPNLTARALRFTVAREYLCVRAGREAFVDCRGDARAA
jgi:plasmid stabilization system protein ParE